MMFHFPFHWNTFHYLAYTCTMYKTTGIWVRVWVKPELHVSLLLFPKICIISSQKYKRVRAMVFNTTFNNISVTCILELSVLLVEETGVPRDITVLYSKLGWYNIFLLSLTNQRPCFKVIEVIASSTKTCIM